MTIRKATNSETQAIINYAPSVITEATMGYVKPSPEIALQIVSLFLASGGSYLVYSNNGIIQGWVGVGEVTDNYTNEKIGFIAEIYVLPAYRKQGVAHKLCKEVFKQMKEQSYRKVQLNVFSGNEAKQLYHKFDFHDVSTLMEKRLK